MILALALLAALCASALAQRAPDSVASPPASTVPATGTIVYGNLASLTAADGDEIKVAATRQPGGGYYGGLEMGYSGVPSGAASLSVTTRGNAGVHGIVQVHLWNWGTGAFDVITSKTMPSTSSVLTYALSASQVAAHRDSSGNLRVLLLAYCAFTYVPTGYEWWTDAVGLYSSSAAPTNLFAASDPKVSKIDLSWLDNATDETGYQVERQDPGSTAWNVVAANLPPNTNVWTNTGLLANATYNYRVAAKNPAGLSAYSNVASATTLAPAAKVFASAFAISSSQVALYWRGVASASGYNVYRSTVSGGMFVKITPTPVSTPDPGPGVVNGYVFSDSGLTSGTEYFYLVKPVYSGGIEGQSGPESSDTPNNASIPWNTGNASAILAQLDQSSPPGWESGGAGTVVGPNGVSYCRQAVGATPTVFGAPSDNPDGETYTYGGDQATFPGDWQNIIRPSTGEIDLGETKPNPTGPYRRVVSKPGYTDFDARINLPGGSNVHIVRTMQSGRAKDSGDTADIYSGGVAGPYFIDAGLSKGADILPGWWPLIFCSEQVGPHEFRKLWGEYMPNLVTPNYKLYATGSVTLRFGVNMSAGNTKLAYLLVRGDATTGGKLAWYNVTQNGYVEDTSRPVTIARVFLAVNRFTASKRSITRVKRSDSIAQAIGGEHPDPSAAYHGLIATGSYVMGSIWSEVKANGEDFDYNVVEEAGSYPKNVNYINFQTTNPWFEELMYWIKTKP